MILSLLHTSPAHIPVFEALREAGHPDVALRHVIREDLLVRAGQSGPDSVADDVRTLLETAVRDGADAVLCTCSSIGAVAEEQAAGLGVPVLRVDRPMAEAAVAAGERIAVIATTDSTFGPTGALLRAAAGQAGRRVTLIEGSSVDEAVVEQVRRHAEGRQNVLVLLDSNHTHEHVLRELELYSPLVRRGNYLVVFDTIIEDMPPGFYRDRPWDRGNNPKTAVHVFLGKTDRFRISKEIQHRLLLTVAPDGYLECVR